MNAVLGIPRRVSDAICFQTVATVELALQKSDKFCLRLVLGELHNQVHPAVVGVAAIAQKLVDHLLRTGKSEGRRRDALRFFYGMDLFLL